MTDPDALDEAEGVVLPGVGAFGPTVEALRATGFDRAVKRFIDSGRPFLGICVGMQVLYDGSEESPGVPGLGVVEGVVRRLPSTVRVPQMQWNRLRLAASDTDSVLDGLGDSPWVYFVHSYAADVTQNTIATSEYGREFSAAIAVDNISATQFHPEKSGPVGLQVLTNFVGLVGTAK